MNRKTMWHSGVVPGVSAHLVPDTLANFHDNVKEVFQLCVEEFAG